MKDGDIERLCRLLAVVGLKVVPIEYRCVNPEVAQAQMVMYKAAMARVDPVTLLWGEESDE